MFVLVLLSAVVAQQALDGNLQRGGGGSALDSRVNPGGNQRVAQQDYRSRNLIVTGDVTAGRGFRGSVGYVAEDDFRGATSGIATRDFRAYTANTSASALATIPVNDRYSLATAISAQPYLRDYWSTNPTGVTGRVGDARANTTGPQTQMVTFDRNFASTISRAEAADERIDRDMKTRRGSMVADIGSIYSPSTISLTRDSQRRPLRLLSSPFTGVVAVPDGDLIESLQYGVYGSALLRDDLRSGRVEGRKMVRSYLSGLVPEQPRSPQQAPDTRLDTRAQPSGASVDRAAAQPRMMLEQRTPYDRVLASSTRRVLRAQGKSVSSSEEISVDEVRQLGALSGLVRKGLDLRPPLPIDDTDRVLGKSGASANAPTLVPSSSPSAGTPAGGTPAGGDASTPNAAGTTPDGASGSAQAKRSLTPEQAYLVLAHGETVSQLDGGSKEALDSLLRLGDDAMRKGRFFSAEKDFIAASQIAPANVLPLAGLINAQVAAGLQMSASVSMRRLFINWPEMIDTRYAMDLLGGEARLRTIAGECIKRSEGSRSAGDYGLITAWIGHQLSDRELVTRGLDILALSPNDSELQRALRIIWLRTTNDVPLFQEQQPAPAAPPTPSAP
ncbi:MAG: hypothetical protein EBR10_04080 [Planctomycetes bacterium]|nr:hypothetical protein [Planctomycetota bacterium]